MAAYDRSAHDTAVSTGTDFDGCQRWKWYNEQLL